MTRGKNRIGRVGAVAALAAGCLFGCAEKEETKPVETRPLVRVGAVTNGVAFADALKVQGMIRAKSTAAIAARVPGTIDALLADEGENVAKGQALFRVDQVNLSNAVRVAKDDIALAKAHLAQAESTEAKARLDAERMARLVKEGAVTKDMSEKAEVAAKSHAAALLAAKATVAKAETGLAVAEKNLADGEVCAPFAGIITRKHKNAGDFCAPGAKVFELEDTSRYEVCCALNAAHYARVKVGETEIEMEGERVKVTYKAPAVNPLTRTFEVRASVLKRETLAAGMLADCRIVFARRRSQAVPAAAVAERGGGDCLFVVRGGRAVRVAVKAGLSAEGLREVLAPALAPNEQILVEGQLLVNEGDEVRVVR